MSERILIVDDDELLLSCYDRLLRKRFKIETASGSQEALRLIMTSEPYAVVLSDMRMTGLTGVQLLSKAKARSSATVGVLVTGDADIDETQLLCTGVVFKVIQKPCSTAVLFDALEEALQSHKQKRSAPAS